MLHPCMAPVYGSSTVNSISSWTSPGTQLWRSYGTFLLLHTPGFLRDCLQFPIWSLSWLARTMQPILSLIFSTSMNNRRTKTGQNIWYLIGKHSQASFDDLLQQRQYIKRSIVNPLDSEEVWKVDILREIALFKKGMIDIDFDEGDLDDILDKICTD